ncbi:hypothetical protein AB0O91_07840 [Kitasatospora sp. NPDC089797]|uniref:hypothetical protein n=1 Tax=Kitasatospora sp. NPDC089797 TaxID=3155298 RepID=UPI003412A64D
MTWRRVRQGVLAVAATVAVFAAIGAVTTGVKPRPGGDPTSVPAPAGAADRRESTPIAVTVRWPGRADGCEQYLVDRPPSQVPRPPAPADVAAWVSQVGAVPGHYGSVELAVQGTGSETVVLTALNVRVVRTGAPLTWNAYAMGEGCGGGVDLHSYDLDLDAARPRLVVSGGSTGLPLKVSERDPEVIEVSAETISHDVDWYLELEWSSGDRKGTLTVGPGTGAPFRTSAVRNRPLYRVPNGGNAWEPAPVQE